MASRVNYKTILAKYKAIGKPNVRLTQSDLFLTKPINPNATQYTFDVLETQNATTEANEIRLNLNDEFIVTHLGLYLQTKVSNPIEDTGVFEWKLFTYVPGELDNLSAIKTSNFYQGQLQISVNNIVYIDKWSAQKHQFVPRTQFANFITPNGASQPSFDYSKNAMYPVEPLVTLSGAKKNQITLTLPKAISQTTFVWTDDKGGVTQYGFDRVALRLYGLNAQNGASFQK